MRSITLEPIQQSNVTATIEDSILRYNQAVSAEHRDHIHILALKMKLFGLEEGLNSMGIIISLHFEQNESRTGKITKWEIL